MAMTMHKVELVNIFFPSLFNRVKRLYLKPELVSRENEVQNEL